jgi:ABC-type lipoprotein release transport system permease subunit
LPGLGSNHRVGVSRLWCRAEYRRSWFQYVIVALLIGCVGAAVLTCVAAARRTDSAFDRYVEAQAIPALESGVADPSQSAKVAADVAKLPGVRTVGVYDAVFAAPDRPDVLPGDDFLVFTPLDNDYGRTIDRLIVLDGRMPAPGAADEVIVNERAVSRLGLRVGARVQLRSIGATEADAMQRGDYDKITFAGPKPVVTVVGVGRARTDLFGSSYVSQYALASPAFTKSYRSKIYGFGAQLDARLEPGADHVGVSKAMGSLTGSEVQDLGNAASALRDTARIQSVALLLIALTALLAGALVVGQAIGRMVRSNRPDFVALSQLGVDRPARVRAATIAFLPGALAGSALALIGAWIGSRWFPTGLLRQAEVATGMQLDGYVFALGGAAIVIAVLLRAAAGAARAAARQRTHRVRPMSWTDRVAARLAPPGATGIRWAVGRAERRRPLSGVVAAIVGVAGLLAVTTYTNQLEHIVNTPATYGVPVDASAEVGNDPKILAQLRDAVLAKNTIGDVAAYEVASRVTANGVTMQGWAFEDVRGHIEPTVVHGRAPTRDSEALLGTQTAKALGVSVNDRVRVRGTTSEGRELTVVGFGLFPNSDTDEIATGILTTRDTLDAMQPEEPRFGVGFRWKPSVDVAAESASFGGIGVDLTPGGLPPDIANMRVVRSYPWWLAGFLVVLSVLATTNALVVATRRRRHEMAILGAIGFSRRQLTEAVAIQGVTVGLLAAIIGIPAGLAIGKWVWATHADRVGLSTTISIPVGAAIAVGTITIALTVLIAVATARSALRARLATALQTE